MTDGGLPAERAQIRASDADRERVAQVLQQAMGEGRLTLTELDERLEQVYAARTLGELEPLTRDLPVPRAATAPASSVAGKAPTWSVGVLSGFQRKRGWIVPERHSALVYWGGGELDLSEARFTAAETTINAIVVMGGIEIKVPENATVHVEGVGFMGGFDGKAEGEGTGDGPVIRITGFAFMGGVEVRRKGKGRKGKGKRRKPELES
ncbi:hypothetical protein GCM10012275_05920 [Longimycelium tulufanense]|uniref:DUF1707 domain-containing protein n=1 Tax=Longimycelium tulufanense TaxID=907463 RepID=A0A8J3C9Z8_9PSEU|nr:DUF1707 domain-containing protein [Longimycelium tulufanense]GGM37695.1 hypothetical protein GCM10012275_05920 [Longimycelium tulufanense]